MYGQLLNIIFSWWCSLFLNTNVSFYNTLNYLGQTFRDMSGNGFFYTWAATLRGNGIAEGYIFPLLISVILTLITASLLVFCLFKLFKWIFNLIFKLFKLN